MITKSQKIRLGIFITLAMIILISVLTVLSIDKFFRAKDIYYIAYKNISVSGLDEGSSVRYLGIKVGSIKNIKIDPKDISRVIVTIGIKKGTPIHADVRADIAVIGITGIRIIELSGGSNKSALLEPGDYIKAGSSLTDEITGKAEVLADKIELILNNMLSITDEPNQQKLKLLLEKSASSMNNIDAILTSNQNNIKEALFNLNQTTAQLSTASKSLTTTINALETIVTSDSLKIILSNFAKIADKLNQADIYSLTERLSQSADQATKIMMDFESIIEGNRPKFDQTMRELNQTARYLNSAARQIDENPAILLSGSKPDNPPDDKLER